MCDGEVTSGLLLALDEHVRVDRAGLRLGREAPDFVEQLFPRLHAAGAPHQREEQPELERGQHQDGRA